MKKKYRIRPNSIAGFVVRNKKGLTMIAVASIILEGMSAATLAFAAEVTEQPEEEPVAISCATPCEEVNTEPEEPELVSLGEFKITYYCPCEICCGIWSNPENPTTASGARAEAGKTIAVDPTVIPYGTEVVINNHTYTAQDSGSAIKDKKIDIYVEDHQEALQLGVDFFEVFVEGGAADV